ncbi:hypothetical protein OHS33_25300 [Streptomyces sp. NBC_00536]|uniref:hypothetical protein n=1 Tax=Streptomyces sp. NBC_00536 TaxID=2975769 RepID=UPI002E80AE15|nr:hypothetical protein [Streptomyces sp. NBC_00536]WUC83894.1 hypothetical protein OHS33_25300 [Streptomyces sp. NBC_00536]
MRTWRDGHARADDAAESLRAALVALGVPEVVWRGMRPTVSAEGFPCVQLPLLPADVVGLMAEAITRGGGGTLP